MKCYNILNIISYSCDQKNDWKFKTAAILFLFLLFHPFLYSLFSRCFSFLLSQPCSFPSSLHLFLLSEWQECIPYAPSVAPRFTIARAQNWLEFLAVLERAGISRRAPWPTWHTVPPFPLTGTPLADTALTESNEAQATSLLCSPLLQSIASSSRP